MSLLNTRINGDIDLIIERLEQIKNSRTYNGRIVELQKVSTMIDETCIHWDDKLQSLMD